MTEKITKLKYHILYRAHCSIADVAREVGRSRQVISNVCNGKACGRKTAEALIRWSAGVLTYDDLYDVCAYDIDYLDNTYKNDNQGLNGGNRDDRNRAA